jgi:integration host factor subunit alpha
MTVTREYLTEAVYQQSNLSHGEARELVDRVFAEISDALVRGEDVKVANFGTFEGRRKRARVGRNPKRPEAEYEIGPRRVVTFKASLALRETVDRGNARPTTWFGPGDRHAAARLR